MLALQIADSIQTQTECGVNLLDLTTAWVCADVPEAMLVSAQAASNWREGLWDKQNNDSQVPDRKKAYLLSTVEEDRKGGNNHNDKYWCEEFQSAITCFQGWVIDFPQAHNTIVLFLSASLKCILMKSLLLKVAFSIIGFYLKKTDNNNHVNPWWKQTRIG